MKAFFLLSAAALFGYATAVCPLEWGKEHSTKRAKPRLHHATIPLEATMAFPAPPVNTDTINLIKEFEGFVPSPRPDPIGLPTVGYGHLCKTRGCSEVPFRFPLTEANAVALLRSDLITFQNCVNSYINQSVHLNDNQYGALVSWAFNVGCGNVKTSSLVRRLNAGEEPNTVAAQELPKWNKGGGKVLPGLVRRRAAEVKLFKTLSSVSAHPC